MAATMREIEVFVMVDSDGWYVAHEDRDELAAAYLARIDGAPAEKDGFRVVKLTVNVPLPEVIELRGEAAADPQPGELKAV